jgi:S-adenosylmethionine decarboxylase proenzyme
MKRAALAAQTTLVQSVFHRFSPQGVSGVVVVEESHLSIHTWPEYGYAAVDFFTCGEGLPESAHAVLREGLGAERSEVMKVERGLPPSLGPGMKVARHWVEEESVEEESAEEQNAEEQNAEAPAAQAPC